MGWSITALWLLWRPGTRREQDLALKVATLHPIFTYAPFFIAVTLPGAEAEDKPGQIPRVAGVPVNLFVAGVASGLSALGYLLARADDRRGGPSAPSPDARSTAGIHPGVVRDQEALAAGT
ncbi:hypothetical protein [Microtetraspora malaysiensis]|uniref:hypothetical protein n=1 Tax=Microtetraspora malaysiensis TaxID=161358 RepID=UPI003D909F13